MRYPIRQVPCPSWPSEPFCPAKEVPETARVCATLLGRLACPDILLNAHTADLAPY